MARSSPLQLKRGTQRSGQMFTKPDSTGRPTNMCAHAHAHSLTHTHTLPHTGTYSKIMELYREGHGFKCLNVKVVDLPASRLRDQHVLKFIIT